MPSIFGRAIVNTKTNKSGGALAKGDVVVLDSANDNAVTTTTTGATTVTVGIVVEENGIANNASGRVQFGGHVALVNVNASVTRGHYGATHTVAKQATDAGASRVVGAFCYFTTGGTTPEADLFIQPDASSATGNVATDAIWDAAGDLAVGTGANTAAKLTLGAAGGHLARINGAVAWDSGTSNPGSAATGDRYWRTDIGMEVYYDGTRWLTTQVFPIHLKIDDVVTWPLTSTTSVVARASLPFGGTYDLWLMSWYFTNTILTTNDGSNYWTASLRKFPATGASTQIATVATNADTAGTAYNKTAAINALLGSFVGFFTDCTVTVGAPGNARFMSGHINSRLVIP